MSITLNRDSERKPISSANRINVDKVYDYYGASGKIDKIDKFIFNEKLLLIGEDGANLVTRSKPIAFFAEGKYWVNNHAHCIDSTDKFILKYLCLYINALSLEKYVTGSAQPKMTQDNMNSILIALPPYEEQKRLAYQINQILNTVTIIEKEKEDVVNYIAATKSKILDLAIRGQLVPQDPNDEPASVLLERIRAEKEELIKAGKIKRDKKESVIFKGEDNSYYRIKSGKTMCIDSEIPYDIPANWDWVMLPEIVFFQEGPGILRKDFRENGIPLIRISGLQTDTVSLDGCDYLDPEMVQKKWEHFKLELGDVVLCSSASIGKASIVGDDAVGAIPYTGQIRFKMSKAILRDYFLYIAISSVYLNQVNQMKTGNCIQHYGPTHLKEVIIPLPPVREQMLIVSKIKTLFGILDKILLNTD
jgi:type I restriction enzyme S subunit